MCTYSKSNESLLISIMVKSCGRYKTMISLETHTQRIFFLSEEYWTNTFCFSWIFCVYWFNLGFLWSPPLLFEVTQWYALCFLVNKLTSKCMLFIWICLNYGELTTIRRPKWFLSGWLSCVGFYHLVNTFYLSSNFTSFPTLYFIYSKVCHSTMRKRGGSRNAEMLPTLAIGWPATAVRDGEAGCFRKVAGVSIVVAGDPHSVIDTSTVDSQVA